MMFCVYNFREEKKEKMLDVLGSTLLAEGLSHRNPSSTMHRCNERGGTIEMEEQKEKSWAAACDMPRRNKLLCWRNVTRAIERNQNRINQTDHRFHLIYILTVLIYYIPHGAFTILGDYGDRSVDVELYSLWGLD